jgi:hypothetical protein
MKPKQKQAENIRACVRLWRNWDIVMAIEKDEIIDVWFFSRAFLSKVLIISHTSGTNASDLPRLTVVSIDETCLAQLSVFGLMKDRTKDYFVHFFRFVTTRLPDHEPKVFITDRWRTQILAFMSLFSLMKLIFCRQHIETNLRKVALNSRSHR